MRETWYVLETGEPANPKDVKMIDGILTHSSGVAVKYGPLGPKSTGVDPEEEAVKTKAVTSKPAKRGYKTRQAKAE